MKIIYKKESIYINKPDGANVNYYLFPEYELHYNEQTPKTTLTWHHHEKLFETIFIIEGELIAEWKENGVSKKEVVGPGDLIEVEDTPHTFTNHTDKYCKFIVIKQILSGKNKSEIFKTDKVIDQ